MIFFRMTPTIQCFDDQSMQMPSASVLYNNMFFQENHHQLTSASDKTNSRPGKFIKFVYYNVDFSYIIYNLRDYLFIFCVTGCVF